MGQGVNVPLRIQISEHEQEELYEFLYLGSTMTVSSAEDKVRQQQCHGTIIKPGQTISQHSTQKSRSTKHVYRV